MLNLPPSVKIYVATGPTDMRKSFNGLSISVESILEQDPFSGHLFVFRNRRGDRVKILYWDRSGFCIWYKLLEKGTFCLPPARGTYLEMTAADLALILEGIDLTGAKRQKRFSITRKNTTSNIDKREAA